MIGVLELITYEGRGCVRTRLTGCPLCGQAFDDHEPRWKHFLDEHEPEDAGLSPVGERPEAAEEPLFEPVERLPGGEQA